MFGIDAGGTFIKFGNPESSKFEMFELPYDRQWLESHLDGEKLPFLATGAGSREIASWYPDLHIEIVPELMATGLGGAYLSGLETCIVMNIGSGTPILLVEKSAKKVTHISGTGLGSASLIGLAHYMTGISNPDEIEREALAGNPEAVTLLISDIYPNPQNLGLPGDITASNFGKYQRWRMREMKEKPKSADMLAGLHRMVGETLSVIGSLGCRTAVACGAALASGKNAASKTNDVCTEAAYGLTVVVTGGGTLNKALCDHMRRTFEYLHQPYVIPDKSEFGTLHGLFVYKDML